MYDRENANNRKLQYFITKFVARHNDYCLECIAHNEDRAKEILAEKQAEFPNEIFRIEVEEARNCWWCYGTN